MREIRENYRAKTEREKQERNLGNREDPEENENEKKIQKNGDKERQSKTKRGGLRMLSQKKKRNSKVDFLHFYTTCTSLD